MKVRESLTLEVTDLAIGGKALGRDDGRVVFVDRGLPGDHITARVIKSKKSFAEAKLVSIDTPSPERIAARCVHVNQCGGCRMQELPYERQLFHKHKQVGEALRHLGGIAEAIVHPIVPAPSAWNYRNKMEFSFMPQANGPAVLGLHERGTFDKVFAQRECHLTTPLVIEIVKLTQAFAAEHRWPAYHPSRHEGVARFLMVRHLEHTNACAVHLIATSRDLHGLADWARAVRAISPTVQTVTLGINTTRSNVAFMEQEHVLEGSGVITERLLGLDFEVVGNAFLQTNSAQAEQLYSAALAAARLQGDEQVLDLYCGAGTLTLLFARVAREAIGVENVAPAIERAERNARINQLPNARFVCGDSRAVLRQWARGEREGAVKPDVVVVDPPRAGLHPRVVARVAELRPRRVVYVSCNPATMARDLKDFAALGFPLAEVTPYDMFPHTPHIECVARLERAES